MQRGEGNEANGACCSPNVVHVFTKPATSSSHSVLLAMRALRRWQANFGSSETDAWRVGRASSPLPPTLPPALGGRGASVCVIVVIINALENKKKNLLLFYMQNVTASLCSMTHNPRNAHSPNTRTKINYQSGKEGGTARVNVKRTKLSPSYETKKKKKSIFSVEEKCLPTPPLMTRPH